MTAAEADPEKHAKQLAELDLMVKQLTEYMAKKRAQAGPSILERMLNREA